MWFPFNCAKNLKDRQSVVVGQRTWNFYQTLVLMLTFKKYIVEFSLIFVCLLLRWPRESKRNEIASSTAHKFNNNWFLLVKNSETIQKIENVSYFYIWNRRRQNRQNFHFLKTAVSSKWVPLWVWLLVSFSVFSDIYVRLPKSITSYFLSRYSKTYINLNVKSCLKLNGP